MKKTVFFDWIYTDPGRLQPSGIYNYMRVISLVAPFPFGDFGQVKAVLRDILLVLNELILHLLDEVRAAVAELRQVIHRGHDQIEAVEAVEHAHVKGRGDRAFLDVPRTWMFLLWRL